jgi:hypothetical protein
MIEVVRHGVTARRFSSPALAGAIWFALGQLAREAQSTRCVLEVVAERLVKLV